MKTIPQYNWSGSFHYGFRDWHVPASIEALQELVAKAPRIKVLGSRHSFNGIADGEVGLSLSALPLDLEVAADGRSVTIAAHATYGQLAQLLAEKGLALHNLASLPHISIAGAIATATHGSGRRQGNLATAVAGLEILQADGQLLRFRRGEPDFEGAVVHLGALGILTRVTLETEPAYSVAQSVYEGLSWQRIFSDFDAIMDTGYSVSIFTDWDDLGGRIWVKRRVPAGDFPDEIAGARRVQGKRHVLTGLDPANTTEQEGLPGLWSDRLPHFKMGFLPSSGEEIQSEFHIPRQHGVAAIEALAGIRAEFAHLAYTSEFRTVAADLLWLSPQFEQDTVSIHFTWHRRPQEVAEAVRRVEAALSPFVPRPHWGKVFTEGRFEALYPKLPAFRALRERLDPQGKFFNAWLERHILDA
ncbi:dehydrogenase [Xaviernesmea oryzae]|uniref:Dehydrogenase n=1 Tax=Xaviernesmea oryzae TaxID=464029 RepID=A0A1Q9AQX5_9HYPH|nr:D-arabinono-1,4-lactone oxidase [Xaviernesmea oryzae]OLP57779.1 dehydrogenase [Xaviernesmea oryzae]SEL37314.1 xylitol oxidase [Xaviernesmea oryzae]